MPPASAPAGARRVPVVLSRIAGTVILLAAAPAVAVMAAQGPGRDTLGGLIEAIAGWVILMSLITAIAGYPLLRLPARAWSVVGALLGWLPGAAFTLLGLDHFFDWHQFSFRHSGRGGHGLVNTTQASTLVEGALLAALGVLLLAGWLALVVGLRRKAGQPPQPPAPVHSSRSEVRRAARRASTRRR